MVLGEPYAVDGVVFENFKALFFFISVNMLKRYVKFGRISGLRSKY
jgi:hypothetical protein